MSLFGPRWTDGQRVDVNGVIVRLRVNPRARRIILRIDPVAREAVAVAPSVRRLGDAVSFARDRRPWLEDRLAKLPPPPSADRPTMSPTVARRWARAYFAPRLAVHCAALGRPVPRLLLTDTRSRWGSCSPAATGRPAVIRLSWRLILAPPDVADYVAAHECAHLVEANHGPRFWHVVRTLVGDERPHRRWLRAHGSSLHQI